MNKTTQCRLCCILIVANLALIWGNSALPADTSGAMSGWLVELLSFLPENALAHTLLRKIAHFSEFACLGLLMTWLWLLHRKGFPYPLLGLGLAIACVDETIQVFVPGRSSSIWDVWIDTAGFTFGLIILIAGYHIFKHKQPLEEPKS